MYHHRRKPLLVSFLVLVATAPAAFGQELPFSLLADLETTGIPILIPPPIPAPPFELAGSNPAQLLVIGRRLFFVADDRIHGAELWTTDGTTEGTERVVDLCPGACGAVPRLLGELDGKLVFWADDGERGFEPWSTDGSAAGTELLADVCPGLCGGRFRSSLGWLLTAFDEDEATVAGGHLYFAAAAPETGLEIWRTDGTAAGTRRVTDACAGPCDGVDYSQGPLVTVADRVLFWGTDGALGYELWATDGVATWLVADLCPGPGDGGNLERLLALDDRAIFGSDCGPSDGALWITDGTPAGTEILADLPRDEHGHVPWVSDLISLQRGRALVRYQFFGSSQPNELWITDGTADGTARVFAALPDSFRDMVRFGKRAALIAGGRLWVADGKPGGAYEVAGVTATGDVGAAGSRLLFDGVDGDGRRGLYAIGGSPKPRFLSALRAGTGIYAEDLETAVLSGHLVVPAFADAEEGAELWTAPIPRAELRAKR